jgi:hypothetical protein
LKRPKIYGNVDRQIIPICIGADNPDALHYVESIQVDSTKIYTINDIGAEAADSSNPAATLLSRISRLVLDVLAIPASAAIDQRITTSAERLDRVFSEYLQNRVSLESFPERKIVLRIDKPIKAMSGRRRHAPLRQPPHVATLERGLHWA